MLLIWGKEDQTVPFEGNKRIRAVVKTEFLRVDEDQDYVLKKLPCSFLMQDNRCSIYDVRPKACREFPHTDRIKQKQLLNLTQKNTEVCPAVFNIIENLKKELK